MAIRRLPFLLGSLSLAAGIAAVYGKLPAWVPTTPDSVVLLGVLVVLMLLGFFFGSGRTFGRVSQSAVQLELPSMETPPGVRIPGSAFDRQLANLSADTDDEAVADREAVRERLEAVTLRLLVIEHGYSIATAREQLDTGEWTSNRPAAAFFATEMGDGEASVRERVGAFISGEMVFRRRALQVIDEVVELHDESTVFNTGVQSGPYGSDDDEHEDNRADKQSGPMAKGVAEDDTTEITDNESAEDASSSDSSEQAYARATGGENDD